MYLIYVYAFGQVTSVQLRDDLLSMLVAGHETTGSVLTWTLYLLSKVLYQEHWIGGNKTKTNLILIKVLASCIINL